jgi:hypothetical protein
LLDPNNIDPSSSKLLTMGTLSSALEYATKIGRQSAPVSTAYLDSLNVKSFSGSGIVSSIGGTYLTPAKDTLTDTTHVLSVAGTTQLLAQPTPIGTVNPNLAKFTTVTANTFYGPIGDSTTYSTGRFSNLVVDSVTGNFVASNADAVTMTSTSKVLTPGNIPSIFASPPAMGVINPASATFTTLKANSVGGNMVASDGDALSMLSTSKMITPKNIAAILASPGPIGTSVKSTGQFTTITVDTVVTNKLIMPPNGFPFGYLVVSIPKSNDGANFSIKYCYARNDGNTGDITVNSPTMINIYNNGVLNGICQSAFLSGVVTVISGSNVVTGVGTNFTSEFIIGDVISIGSIVKRIISITSATSVIVDSAYQSSFNSLNYYRGGAGLGSLAANTYYNIYVLGGNNITSGYVFSTRNINAGDTLVDLPSGYTLENARQLPYSVLSNAQGVIVDPASPYYVKDSSTGAFLPPATNVQAQQQKLTYVSLTPSNLPSVFSNPGPIGSIIPSTGAFTNLTAGSFSGQGLASNSEAAARTLNNKVITPSNLQSIFDQPPVMGSVTPSSATFTTLTANNISGPCIATDDQARLKSSKTTLITPANLSAVLSAPGTIGSSIASDAYFKTLNSSTLNTNIINVPANGALNIQSDASFNGNIYGTVVSANKYIGSIGDSVSKNTGVFTSLQADSLSGPFIATNADVTAGTSNSKLVTPATLKSAFDSPPVIGKVQKAAGNFTTINADVINVSYPINQRAQLPTMYLVSSDVYTPDYVNFNVQYCYARSADDTIDILINTPKSINITQQGVVNGVSKSGALIGTVTVTQGSNIVTGINTTFNYTFIVGDVISLGGQSYLVTVIDPNIEQITVDRNIHYSSSNSAYYRGGSDTLLPNTIYYFYAIGHPSNPGYIISTRSQDIGQTLVDLPTGYNTQYARQLLYAVQTNSSGVINQQPRALSTFESSSATTQVATNSEAIDKTSTYKALTPSNIPSFMSVPGPIGSQVASTGIFTSLTASSIGGSCIASSNDLINGVSNKIVTPAVIQNLLSSPGTIGSVTPGDGYFVNVITSAPLQVQDNSEAVNVNNASIITKGGLAVAKSVIIGGGVTTTGTATFSSNAIVNSTTVSTNSSTGALVVKGGVGIAGSLYVGGTVNLSSLSVSGNFSIPSTTQSTNTTTGSFVTAGGAGISGNANVGGVLTVNSTNASINSTTGALTVTGGAGIQGSVNIGNNLSVTGQIATSGVALFNNTTGSSSTNTGGIIVAGGAGIAGNTTIGGSITINSDSTINSTTDSNAVSTGALVIKGGLGVAKRVNIAGDTALTSFTQSTNTTTGALTVSGGVGIARNVNIGGNLGIAGSLAIGGSFAINSGIDSTNSTSGALAITGGLGVSASTNIGGNLGVSGTITGPTLSITSNTQSNTAGTGALTVLGGIGVQGRSNFGNNVTIGGTLSVTGSTSVNSTTTSTNSTTGAFTIAGGLGVQGPVNLGSTFTAGSSTLQSLSITANTAATNTTTGSLIVAGGAGVAGSLYVGGSLSLGGGLSLANTSITGSTPSTSTSTGAFTVVGGVGIGGDTNIGGALNVTGKLNTNGDLKINSVTSSTNSTTGALAIAGGLGVQGVANFGNTVNTTGVLNVTNSTNTTATTTGALTIVGSIGAQGNLNVGSTSNLNTVNISGITTINNSTTSNSSISGAFVVTGGVGVQGAFNLGGNMTIKGLTILQGGVSITNTTDSTNITTGAFTVIGGVGVGGASTFGGKVSVSNTTPSTNTTTGALTVSGGVGIGGTLSASDITSNSITLSTLNVSGQSVLGGQSGAESLRVNNTTSAVNRLEVAGSTTGFGPVISSNGPDTNININLKPKGAGLVKLGGKNNIITVLHNDNGVAPIIGSYGASDANVDIKIQPQGFGSTIVVSDLVVTGTVTASAISGSNPTAALPRGYFYVSKPPTYISSTIYNISDVVCRNYANTANLFVSSTNVSLTSVNTINGITTRSLTGTISTVNGSANVTGNGTSFTTDFQVGDIINNNTECRVVSTIVSDTQLTVSSSFSSTVTNGAFLRGGRCANAGYYIYLVNNTNSTAPAYILTSRYYEEGDTIQTVPSGYNNTDYRRLPYKLTTDASANFISKAISLASGLGISSVNKGDVLYGNASGGFSTLGAGTDGQLLMLQSGIPTWKTGSFSSSTNYTVTGTDDSTDTTNGALTVAGGIGVQGSMNVGGSIVAPVAGFNDIVADMIEGNVVAHNTDLTLTSNSSDNQVITPLGLYTVLTSPPVLGDITQNDAKFKNLQCTSLSGSVLSVTSDVTSTNAPSNTVVTPSVLAQFWQNPTFDLGVNGICNGYFDTISANHISGAITADITDFGSSPSSTKFVVPSNIQKVFQTPYDLGTTTRASGYFDELGYNSIKSSNLASLSDLKSGSTNPLFIRPSVVKQYFDSPTVIGSTAPNDAYFASITGNIYYGVVGSSSSYYSAYFDAVNQNSITGSVVPSSMSQLKQGSNTQVMTPYWFLQCLGSLPVTLGDGTTNASFDTLTVKNISGGVFATTSDLIAGTSSTTFVNPSALASYLTNHPPAIGTTNPSTGKFTTLTGTNIYGVIGSTNNKSDAYMATLNLDTLDTASGSIASVTDVSNGVAGKIVDASVLKKAFASPTPIGNSLPSSGKFTTLTATSLSVANGIDQFSGGTGLYSYTTGDMIYADGNANLTHLNIGSESNVLIVKNGLPQWASAPNSFTSLSVIGGVNSTNTTTGDLVITGGVGIGDNTTIGGHLNIINNTNSTNSTTGAFTIVGGAGVGGNLNVGGDFKVNGVLSAGTLLLSNSIPSSSGGTGISSYNNGDLLYGLSNALSVLPIGTSNQVLTVNNGSPIWSTLPNSYSSFTVTGSTNSTNTSTGAFTVTGGIGIGKDLSIGGIVNIGTVSSNTNGYPLFVSSSKGYTSFAGGYSYGSTGSAVDTGSSSYNIQIYTPNDIAVGGAIYSSSDERLKDEIVDLPIDIARSFITDVKPVSFAWKSNGNKSYGYIAQNVIKCNFQNMVAAIDAPEEDFMEYTDEDGLTIKAGKKLTVNYENAIPLIHTVVKDLVNENNYLKNKIQSLEASISKILEKLNLNQ